jgi:pSer/pThr/pTyr-binding forkhead associated (FHA) protein
MNSKHGTLINMRRINDKTALSEGDQIIVGETSLLFTEKDFDTKACINALQNGGREIKNYAYGLR